MSNFHQANKVNLPSVQFRDGRVCYSTVDIARVMGVDHAKLLRFLREWRFHLPGSVRQLVDFEAGQAWVDREVIGHV